MGAIHAAAPGDGQRLEATVENRLLQGLPAQSWDRDGNTPADLAAGREREAIRALLSAAAGR